MPSRPVFVEEHLSPADFAARVSVSVKTVRRAVKCGQLGHKRIGRRVIIPASAGNAWLKKHEVCA